MLDKSMTSAMTYGGMLIIMAGFLLIPVTDTTNDYTSGHALILLLWGLGPMISGFGVFLGKANTFYKSLAVGVIILSGIFMISIIARTIHLILEGSFVL
jgi:hypothetical protein